MSQRRTQILEMVAEGTISIEQADQLLETLEEEAPSQERPRIKVKRERRDRSSEFDQIVQLAALGVKPEFIQQWQEVEDVDIDMEDVLHLAALKITPERYKELRELGKGFAVKVRKAKASQTGFGEDAAGTGFDVAAGDEDTE